MAFPGTGSHLDVAEVLRELQSLGFCSGLEASKPEVGCESPSARFDRILSVFWKEVNRRGEIRTLPVMVGAGRLVDLWSLYCLVRGMGGYDRVSADCGWASVAQAIGVDSSCGSAVKLVFVKYLDALERWVQRLSGKNHFGAKVLTGHFKKLNDNDNGGVVTLETSSVGGGIICQRKKQEALEGMLIWARYVARNPNFYCKVEDLAAEENYARVLLARQALLQKVVDQISPEENQEGNMAICGNDIRVISHAARILNVQPQPLGKESNSCHKLIWLSDEEKGEDPVATVETTNDLQHRIQSPHFDNVDDWFSGDRAEIPVSTSSQAELPDWNGQPFVPSNPAEELKWLGTRIWPPEGQENRPSFNDAAIGRGRQDNCECNFPGSVECTRFHIAEKRLQLKLELGRAFHSWGFTSMGEEITLSWAEGERLKFKSVIYCHRSSIAKNLWSQLYLCFPHRKRKSLLSYYFNMFVLERRRYQNRVTHNNIDSDDDESEFCSSNFLGQDRVTVKDFIPVVCDQNNQCIDLDD
ncbi:AT-rich interactive domain-containing protein 2-like [Zingiber officinale]|uniref:ARID domain-containing protein n=1 Tax=Zingiber officinale TaxID=94328 RepID=A0A8J5H211_ZINOF|nr:AT-rich interactive domain-containing protein 2-like [Zingiber officinale]KAG6515456.1 hypothetical protein ZIOFF_025868 [Zingiber officinale]